VKQFVQDKHDSLQPEKGGALTDILGLSFVRGKSIEDALDLKDYRWLINKKTTGEGMVYWGSRKSFCERIPTGRGVYRAYTYALRIISLLWIFFPDFYNWRLVVGRKQWGEKGTWPPQAE